MITLNLRPDQTVLELGGGDNPRYRPNADVRSGPKVDHVIDFNEPLPFPSNSYDAVFSHFALEHVSWPNVVPLLKEIIRIIKPTGKFICCVPNTEAQIQWVLNNPNGWDEKGPFESCSEVLFGSQDYPENSHKCYLSPGVIRLLFESVGFESVEIHPYGERATDMCAIGSKPNNAVTLINKKEEPQIIKAPIVDMPPDEMFDKHYFGGGGKVGGYSREGYWDFPVHNVTAQHVLWRNPKSVLEIGCARGYVLKRLEDAGVIVGGMEVSKHCYMTRAVNNINVWDICKVPWPIHSNDLTAQFDLCLSVAVLEHIPEESLPGMIREMARTCQRGLHGIDFGHKDDGFDRTHVTLRPKEWWKSLFATYAPGWPVEIVDKEELERGQPSSEVMQGDGKVKLNVGSFNQMFHYGWENIDVVPDLALFAHNWGYRYRQHDVRQGLPFCPTGSVDFIYSSHFLEHLTYDNGIKFLRECRRVMKPDGCIRLIVPDVARIWDEEDIMNLSEISLSLDRNKPKMMNRYDIIMGGDHKAMYDKDTLAYVLSQSGFTPHERKFRVGHAQILRETLDTFPCLSLYMEGTPDGSY